MSENVLAELHADLIALREALDRDSFSEAGQILSSHESRLRQYIDAVGAEAPVQALRELLQLQHQLQHDMLSARDTAASALREMQHASQASRRYRELSP